MWCHARLICQERLEGILFVLKNRYIDFHGNALSQLLTREGNLFPK